MEIINSSSRPNANIDKLLAGFDVWSDENDVDLFYQIEQMYKTDDYYIKFTNDNIL